MSRPVKHARSGSDDNHRRERNVFSLAIEVMEIVFNLDSYISESIKVSAKSIKLDNNDESEACCGYS